MTDIGGIVELLYSMEEEWLSRELAKVMPPELFLRAYGNVNCKMDVAEWMEKEGYHVAIHVGGRKELRKFDKVIATLEKPIFKFEMSQRRDPLSFSV